MSHDDDGDDKLTAGEGDDEDEDVCTNSAAGDDSDDIDDFELVRNIRNQFSIADDDQPLRALPPDEEEDDFETLRRIQQRFGAYECGTSSNKHDQSCDFDGPLKLDSNNTERPTSSERSSMLAFKKGSMPKTALTFIDAIKKNRLQQKFICNRMIHLETRIEENKKLRKRFKILKDFQGSCRRRTGCALTQTIDPRVQLISFGKPHAKDSSKKDKRLSAMYHCPAENSHVACYRMALTKFPPSVDRKRWSNVERENLGKGIRQQFQEMVLQISVDQISGLQGFSADSDDLDNILTSIKDLDITPEKIREFLPKVNWDKLASMYVRGHSGAECEARWFNFEDPLINRNPWTTSEDKNILFTIQQIGLNNWIDLAVSLGTNRTPFQCLTRYQRSLNASILKREWTKDEDEKLQSAVATFGVRDWQAVASTLEGRTGTQCSNRWRKTLDPARTKRGRFTPDEDSRLKIAVLLFGPKNWNKKAEFLPGRNQVQCRERWFNCLDPSLRRCEWTEEEDLKLEIAIQEHGYSWAKVAACVPSRTDNECCRRWKKLFPNEVPLLQEARKIQKAALISNFVDRESERPGLGPTDFRPIQNTNLICNADDPKVAPKRNVKARGMAMPRNETSATGDAPKKRKTKNQRNQPDATAAQVSTPNDAFSVPGEVKSIKPQRKRSRQGDYTAKTKGVLALRINSERCAEQNSLRLEVEAQLNSNESSMINNDCSVTVDSNSMKVCENKVAKQLYKRALCFSEQEENQNSTGSSGVSVLSEATSDIDEFNPFILPAIAHLNADDDIIERKEEESVANKDLDDSNSYSLLHSCLELKTTYSEGADSYSVGEITDKEDRACRPQGRTKKNNKTSNQSQDSSVVSSQRVELDRSSTKSPRCHNQSRNRKNNSTNTNPLGTLDAVEEIDDCTLLGFLQNRSKRATTHDKEVDTIMALEVDDSDNDPTIASLLKVKLKRKRDNCESKTN